MYSNNIKLFANKRNRKERKTLIEGGCPRGVMVKAMDCVIVVNEFELQSCQLRLLSEKYPCERYEPPYPPSYGLNSTTAVLIEGWL